MEVHAHTHTPRKKWTHYFWEFLMLFLAVFCGFLAENKREHIVEAHRAKVYAKALLEDLAKDTTEILDVIREDKLVLTCFDSICAIVHQGIKNNRVPGSFYYYSNLGTVSPSVVWNNTTLTQITQSGNLRYFNNPELVKKISLYFSQSVYITDLNTNDRKYREKSMELRNKILNNYFNTRYSSNRLSGWLNVPDSLLNVSLPIQVNDPVILNEFANSFETRRSTIDLLLKQIYPSALNSAKQMMELLKKEYRLK